MNLHPPQIEKLLSLNPGKRIEDFNISKFNNLDSSWVLRNIRAVNEQRDPSLRFANIAYLDYVIPERIWNKLLGLECQKRNGNIRQNWLEPNSYEGCLQVSWYSDNGTLCLGYVLFETETIDEDSYKLPTIKTLAEAVNATSPISITLPHFFHEQYTYQLFLDENEVVLPLYFDLMTGNKTARETCFSSIRELVLEHKVKVVECLSI